MYCLHVVGGGRARGLGGGGLGDGGGGEGEGGLGEGAPPARNQYVSTSGALETPAQ